MSRSRARPHTSPLNVAASSRSSRLGLASGALERITAAISRASRSDWPMDGGAATRSTGHPCTAPCQTLGPWSSRGQVAGFSMRKTWMGGRHGGSVLVGRDRVRSNVPCRQQPGRERKAIRVGGRRTGRLESKRRSKRDPRFALVAQAQQTAGSGDARSSTIRRSRRRKETEPTQDPRAGRRASQASRQPRKPRNRRRPHRARMGFDVSPRRKTR